MRSGCFDFTFSIYSYGHSHFGLGECCGAVEEFRLFVHPRHRINSIFDPPKLLARIGYDLSKPTGHVNVRGVTGVGTAKLFSATSITALGHTAKNLSVISQDYPKSVTVDGLLGLDFFREKILTIDFHRGTIALRPPYPRWQFWR